MIKANKGKHNLYFSYFCSLGFIGRWWTCTGKNVQPQNIETAPSYGDNMEHLRTSVHTLIMMCSTVIMMCSTPVPLLIHTECWWWWDISYIYCILPVHWLVVLEYCTEVLSASTGTGNIIKAVSINKFDGILIFVKSNEETIDCNLFDCVPYYYNKKQ